MRSTSMEDVALLWPFVALTSWVQIPPAGSLGQPASQQQSVCFPGAKTKIAAEMARTTIVLSLIFGLLAAANAVPFDFFNLILMVWTFFKRLILCTWFTIILLILMTVHDTIKCSMHETIYIFLNFSCQKNYLQSQYYNAGLFFVAYYILITILPRLNLWYFICFAYAYCHSWITKQIKLSVCCLLFSAIF